MSATKTRYDSVRHGHTLESLPASSTPTIDVSLERSDDDGALTDDTHPPLWQHRLSASFAAMAEQIAATSQALAHVPCTSTATSAPDVGAELEGLKARLEAIEQTQMRMAAELEALHQRSETNGCERPDDKLVELEKKLDALSETVKLDRQRLPARLHNAVATENKGSLTPPVMANGKPAPGFPSTRGEFEHITKERYEALLKLYGEPVGGDTDAKRARLRTFAGIPE